MSGAGEPARDPERPLRVLVLTNQFENCCGAEVVALEIVRWFLARGDEATLGVNLGGYPMLSSLPPETPATDDPETLRLEGYDLVWCQHDLLSLLPLESYERAAALGAFPLVAYVALSPFEPHEVVDLLMVRALSAELWANSEETCRALVARGRGLVGPGEVRLFHNAAPGAFWAAGDAAVRDGASRPRRVAFVSHHPPPEVLEAADRLRAEGVDVASFGIGREHRLLQPADLVDRDAIVTIGKTAVYAVATGTPVFLYDHLGGDGWLTEAAFERAAEHNFSGRPGCRRLSAEELTGEILDGYREGAAAMRAIRARADLLRFRLGRHLAALRDRACARREDPGPALARLEQNLADAAFRAHYDSSRAKHLVMRRVYRARPPR